MDDRKEEPRAVSAREAADEWLNDRLHGREERARLAYFDYATMTIRWLEGAL